MPKIGEIRSGSKRPLNDRVRRIWLACIDCGKERWVRLALGQPRHPRCFNCGRIVLGFEERGANHPRWKGGRIKTGDGYLARYVDRNNPFFPMAAKIERWGGYVLEHRLVMAQSLGRCLTKKEIVHHKNGNKQDNRIENLQLTIRSNHSLAYKKAYMDGYKDGQLGLKVKWQEISFTVS